MMTAGTANGYYSSYQFACHRGRLPPPQCFAPRIRQVLVPYTSTLEPALR